MKRLLFISLMIAAVAVLAIAGGDGEAQTKTDAALFTDYSSWAKVNDSPITEDITGALGKAHEANKGIREVYVNSTGQAVSMGQSPYPYPAGSILVKEAYKGDDGQKGALSAITVMIKREPGYDSENGDWEYAMLTSGGKVRSQGPLGMCIDCHAAGADKDYTFTGK